jgi:hypothetical protein
MDLPKRIGRIRTTNALAELLELDGIDRFVGKLDYDAIDLAGKIKVASAGEGYEEKEREIPELIFDVIKKHSMPFTRFVRRTYFEEDAWLVSIEHREGEWLLDHDHDVCSALESGEILPALIDEMKSHHFVKIHVPDVFVRTLSLPMIGTIH